MGGSPENMNRLAVCILCACGFLAFFAKAGEAAEQAQTRYLRAVYVMRKLDPSLAAANSPSIPRRIVLDDTTNTWIKHPDTTFVLTTLAREFSQLAKHERMQEAEYWAAQALYKLGRKNEAASAMRRYLQSSRARSEDYRFLVRSLYEDAQFPAMREAASEWLIQDPRCDEERAAYLWGSYMAEGDLLMAGESLRASSCRSWRTEILSARIEMDAGNEDRAEQMIHRLKDAHPAQTAVIEALWQEVRYARQYP